MKRKQHKWLLRKVSGSRGKYAYKPDFSETRHEKSTQEEILPFRKSMKKRGGTHLDTSLVKRWLHSQVGRNFDIVYSEFLKRIQPKYLESYKECIFYYVTKAHELLFSESGVIVEPFSNLFYIDPDTNLLQKHAEFALKNAKNIHLLSVLSCCSFWYNKGTKQWEGQKATMCKVIIHDPEIILTKNDFSTIDFVIKNENELNRVAQKAMNDFAVKYRNTDLLFSAKYLLSIHFDVRKGLKQYYLLYEVAKGSSKDWKVIFEGSEVLEIERVRRS
jgi:hypothetical protein